MEPKKSKKANIEKDKAAYFALGLVVSISLSIVAFEWNVPPPASQFMVIKPGGMDFTDEIPQTIQEDRVPAPPTRPPDVFEIVDDYSPVIGEIDWGTDEMKQDEAIPWENYVIVTQEQPEPDSEPLLIVSDMPSFRGGNIDSFSEWVQRQVRYPAIAAEIGIQEKIYLTFVVDKDGAVSDIEILKGTDQSLKEEVFRVMKSAPKWTPGSHMGQPARVRFSLVVNFRLQN